MPTLFHKADLPHFHSTRDTRDRLDLVTDNVPVGARHLKADRIVYHPGDTCARHLHRDSYQLFVVLDGEGLGFTPDGPVRLTPGMAFVVGPDEVHWFENDTDENFTFVEFWAPLPRETVWVDQDDC